MSFFDELQDRTAEHRDYLLAAPAIQDCFAGRATREMYVAFLTQAYHHVKHTVPLLMACGSRLPARLDWLRNAVGEYISEETGHEQWVLDDIEAAGGDPQRVRQGRPNLATELMVSYAYDTITRGNPVGFFGMVFVLEGTSTALATDAAAAIRRTLGLPEAAVGYLVSHGSLDVSHMDFFRGLMDRLDRDEDRDAVVHTARAIFKLYGDVFRSLPDAGGRCQPLISEAV